MQKSAPVSPRKFVKREVSAAEAPKLPREFLKSAKLETKLSGYEGYPIIGFQNPGVLGSVSILARFNLDERQSDVRSCITTARCTR